MFFSREKVFRAREKTWKNRKKCTRKHKSAREIFHKILPVKLKLMHVKKNTKTMPVKLQKCPWKSTNIVFNWFSPREKNEKTALEKIKSGREKSEKWAKKWAWTRKTAREKNQKKAKNSFHGHFLFSREKKNTALVRLAFLYRPQYQSSFTIVANVVLWKISLFF